MIPFGTPRDLANDDGYLAWLRYAPQGAWPQGLPRLLVSAGEHPVAVRELRHATERLFGQPIAFVSGTHYGPALRIGLADELGFGERLRPEGYAIRHEGGDLILAGADARGVLYGTFALLRRLTLGQPLEVREEPAAPIRFLNHWDNPDGTIERGYAGRSIFYEGYQVTEDLWRVEDYARLLASIGINGCSLNNVNADPWIVFDGLPQVAKLADAMRPFGIRTLVSVRFDSPLTGGLASFDPLLPDVAAWWRDKIDEIYHYIPDLVGVVIKADSEGQPGASATGRTHADAANMLARALDPHGGLVFYRGFVYNHKMDWRDRSLDRARAQLENFQPLDGQFEDNVILQIKNGPIDFQVREPVSPAFLALKRTRMACELMITQEYLGQQHHTVYEVPWWKDSLSVPGVLESVVQNGFVAVCGVGRDRNWMGNHLAQANLYGYGRLVWDPTLSSEAIAEEWTAQTLGGEVVEPVTDLLMRTWPAYEDYTGNLGIGGLTDIIHVHYGPSPISSEHNGWGQWHRSDEHGTGMDRTVATGTGMTAHYPIDVYEHLETCPEELLVFFHHVPYTHRLKNGSTVIQHIYDRHYAGAEEAARMVEDWRALAGRIDLRRYRDVLDQLTYQAGHALVWRDSVCQWFARLSGIPDERGRVFHEPNRIEAEAMELEGYEVVEVEPWEAASGGRAVVLAGDRGVARLRWGQGSGSFELWVWHFDVEAGRGRYELRVNGRPVDAWQNTGRFPSRLVDAHTRTRRRVGPVVLADGDVVECIGFGPEHDRAALDFIEFRPI